MSNIPKRLIALRLLRDLMLISFIASLCSLISIIIVTSFGNGYQFSEVGGNAIMVLDAITGALRFAVLILLAATFILTMRINKECGVAFFVVLGTAILAIVGGTLEYIPQCGNIGTILVLVSWIIFALALFALIDGIFDQQARHSSLFRFAVLGLILLILSSISNFVSYGIMIPSELAWLFYLLGEFMYVMANLIIFLSLHSCLKEIEVYELEELKEAE